MDFLGYPDFDPHVNVVLLTLKSVTFLGSMTLRHR